MRYYDIIITGDSGKEFARWNTINSTGLHIELNAPVTALAAPAGEVTLKVFNIPLTLFTRSMDFQGKSIKIRAGMSKGLPLANEKQQGLIVQGKIFFCSGVREGTTCYLMMTIFGQSNPQREPKNIVLNWKQGTRLSEAIKETMKGGGYPADKVLVELADYWVAHRDEAAAYGTMSQFAAYLHTYSGRQIHVYYSQSKESYLFTDLSKDKTPKQLEIYDFIGQPTWLGGSFVETTKAGKNIGLISAKVVLRGDLEVTDYVEIKDPLLAQLSGPAAFNISQRGRLAFKGKFQIVGMTHFANYINLPADNWATILTLATTQ